MRSTPPPKVAIPGSRLKQKQGMHLHGHSLGEEPSPEVDPIDVTRDLCPRIALHVSAWAGNSGRSVCKHPQISVIPGVFYQM